MRMLLSCISTTHSVLKQHWTDTREKVLCPLTVLGSYQKPQEDQGGILCLVDEMGFSQKIVGLRMPAGMASSGSSVLVASPEAIHEVSSDLSQMQRAVVSLPLFNALHSLSPTKHGYLVASTGLDLLVEFNHEGEVLWSWWATDAGFDQTPDGQTRVIDKTLDHRGVRYGTLQQTTHVNSAAELADGRILASLFHQGMVIVIERETGAWHPVLEDLDHPHAIRILDEKHFTVADTRRGRAVMATIEGNTGRIEATVDAETDWLQDCHYVLDHDCWVLVDGKNSRVSLRRGPAGDRALARFDFDPEWRLYEALLV